MRLSWRLDALDEWRKDVDRQLVSCVERIDGLTKADEIAEAVAKKMHDDRTLVLTVGQKAAAFLVGGVMLAGAVKGLWPA